MSRSNFAFICMGTIAKEQKFGYLEFNMNLFILPFKYYLSCIICCYISTTQYDIKLDC